MNDFAATTQIIGKVQYHKTGAGFTLIEFIIYLALFGILMGGVAAGVYAIVEGGGRSQAKTSIQEEGNFLLGKFNWALSGASSINVVALPPNLAITKYNYALNPLVFDVSGSELRLRQGGGLANDLNSSNVFLKSLTFQDIPKSNGKPEGLTINFTLTALTSAGAVESQNFEITKFLAQ
jgi:type II secretory pathway pseudopilin PulG